MDLSLRDSDQWELLCSLYTILEEYYGHYETLKANGAATLLATGVNFPLATEKRKHIEPDLHANKRARSEPNHSERLSKISTELTAEEKPLQKPPTRAPFSEDGQAQKEPLPPTHETKPGPDPLLFSPQNSLLRTMLPASWAEEPEKVELTRQYTHIDQLVTELSLIAANTTTRKSLLTLSKKDFLKKLQTDNTYKTEFQRIAKQLPPAARSAIYSENGTDYLTYFCREGTTANKPYLTTQMRQNLQLFKDCYIPGLIQGDVIHVPFTLVEERVIDSFPNPQSRVAEIAALLPGRAGIDIERFLIERDANQNLVFQGEPIIYSDSKKPRASDQLTTITKREFRTRGTVFPEQKNICRSLLSSLIFAGVSTAPTEAVVDCKLDPTGQSGRIIVGTARNETMNATNVSVLYDAAAGTINCLTEHTDTVSASDFSIDGTMIITASYDKNIIVRNASDGIVLRYLGRQDGQPVQGHTEKIQNMALHKSKRQIIATFSHREILLWNIETGKLLASLADTSGIVQQGDNVDMCFSEGFRKDLLIVGSEASNARGELRIWDTNTSSLVYSGIESRGMVSSIATDKGNCVVAATKGVVRMFDLRSPDETLSLYKTGQKDVNIVSYSPCQRFIQSSGTDNRCVVFDARNSERPLHILNHLPPLTQTEVADTVGINSTIWTRDGGFIVTGGEDGFVRVWDLSIGDPLINALESKSPICGCDVSQNFDMIVSGDEAATIKLWSVKDRYHQPNKFIMNDEDLVAVGQSRANRDQDILNANLRMQASDADRSGHPQPLFPRSSSQEEVVYFDPQFSGEDWESGFSSEDEMEQDFIA